MSYTKIGYPVRKGKNNPNFNRKHTPEEIQKQRIAQLGKRHIKKFRGFPDDGYDAYYKKPFRKPSSSVGVNKGKKFSIETRKKMSYSRIRYIKTVKPSFMTSVSGKQFLDALECRWNVDIEREVELDGRFFDGRIGNLLIEVDNSYWHSLPHRVLVDQQKNEIAKRNGYELQRFIVESSKDVKRVISEIGESHE